MPSPLLLCLAALLTITGPVAPVRFAPVPAHRPAAPTDFWREVPAAQARRLGPPRLAPRHYRVLALDLAGFKAALAGTSAATGPTLALPLPAGGQQAFQLRTSSVLAPELAARYPELRTYAGQTAPPSADYLRLEITPAGLRAMLVHQGRTVLIEPFRASDTQHYLCFDKAALPPGSKQKFEVPGGPLR